MERVHAALVEHAQQQGFNRVVAMVAQGHLVRAQLATQVGKRAPAHFGAQGTGVLFLALFKNDLADLRFPHGVGHFQPLAQRAHAAQVEGLHAHGERDGGQFEGVGAKPAVQRHGIEQQQAVLAAGYPHGHAVAGGDHVKILVCAPDATEHFLQNGFPFRYKR